MRIKLKVTKIVDGYLWKVGSNPSLDTSTPKWLLGCLESGKVKCMFPYEKLIIEHSDHVDMVNYDSCVYLDENDNVGYMSMSSFKERCELLL